MKKVYLFLLALLVVLVVCSCSEQDFPIVPPTDEPIQDEPVVVSEDEIAFSSTDTTNEDFISRGQETITNKSQEQTSLSEVQIRISSFIANSYKNKMGKVTLNLKVKDQLNLLYRSYLQTSKIVLENETTFDAYQIKVQSEVELVNSILSDELSSITMTYLTTVKEKALEDISQVSSEMGEVVLEVILDEYLDVAFEYYSHPLTLSEETTIKNIKRSLSREYSSVVLQVKDEQVKAQIKIEYDGLVLELCSLYDLDSKKNYEQEYLNRFNEVVDEYTKAEEPVISEEEQIQKNKQEAKEALDNLYNNTKKLLPSDVLVARLDKFYQSELQKINQCNNLEESKHLTDSLQSDLTSFLTNVDAMIVDYAKDAIKEAINSYVIGLETQSEYEPFMDAIYVVQNYLNEKVDQIETLEQLQHIDETLITLIWADVEGPLVEYRGELRSILHFALDEIYEYLKSQELDENQKTLVDAYYIILSSNIDQLGEPTSFLPRLGHSLKLFRAIVYIIQEQNTEPFITILTDDLMDFQQTWLEPIPNEWKELVSITIHAELEKLEGMSEEELQGEVMNLVEFVTPYVQSFFENEFPSMVRLFANYLKDNRENIETSLENREDKEQLLNIVDEFILNFENTQTLGDVIDGAKSFFGPYYEAIMEFISPYLQDIEIKEIDSDDVDYEELVTNTMEVVEGYIEENGEAIEAVLFDPIWEKIDAYLIKYIDLLEAANTQDGVDTLLATLKADIRIEVDGVIANIASQNKQDTLVRGETFYKEMKNSTEYKSLGLITGALTKLKIESAYLTFQTTMNNLSDDIVGLYMADQAYNTLVDTCNEALGK